MGSVRRSGIVAALVALFTAFGASTASAITPTDFAIGPAGQAFYDPPHSLPAGKHGDVIWAREVRRPPEGRATPGGILYRSEDANGKATVSSGFLAAPEGTREGRAPRARVGHGTEGAADNCAPSKAPSPARGLVDTRGSTSPFQQDTGVPGIKQFLDAGYAVVATDYAGLGPRGRSSTPSPSPSCETSLDSVIAAQRLIVPRRGWQGAAWSSAGRRSRSAAIWVD